MAWPGSNATGLTEISTVRSKFGTKSLHQLMLTQGGGIQKDVPFPINKASVGDVVYFGMWVYKINGTPSSAVIRLFDYQVNANPINVMSFAEFAAAPSGQWLFTSSVKTITTQGIRIYVGAAANAIFEHYVDGFVLLNLSQSGKTKTQMDNIIMDSNYFASINI